MRPTRGLAACAILHLLSATCVAEAAGPTDSATGQVWFERALRLDLGVGSAPDAAQAFAAMRRAAEAGSPQAAFNVAVMLDNGRGAPRDVAQAAVWYARAAARGVRRGAFNLGMLYERGEGVPANADLARAWYAAADLPAARERAANLGSRPDRPSRVKSPKPLFPVDDSLAEGDDPQVDLVWTSPLQPEPARFFVELRGVSARASKEVWSGFVDVSSVRLPLPAGFDKLAWRVSAVAPAASDYAVSDWSVFAVPGAAMAVADPGLPKSASPEAEPARVGDLQSSRERRPPAPAPSQSPIAAAPSAPRIDVQKTDDGTAALAAPKPAERVASPAPKSLAKSASAAPTVLIILAQASVTKLSDLDNKAVVIAGLTSISPAAVNAALHAAGANAVRLTEGTKSDIDKLVDGDIPAAVVAYVTSAKAETFPQIAGLHLLRVIVNERTPAAGADDVRP